MARPSSFLASRIFPAAAKLCKSLAPLVWWGVWFVLPLVVAGALVFSAFAQFAEGQQPRLWSTPRAAGPVAQTCEIPHPAVCQIRVRCVGGTSNQGTGTLIETDGSRTVVMTAEHLFEGAATPLHVDLVWPNGQRTISHSVTRATGQDLAAVVLDAPLVGVDPVEISDKLPKLGEIATAAGWGPDLCYRSVRGTHTSYETSKDGRNRWIVLTGASVRSGDSGGPIFGHDGKLRGVLWGRKRNQINGSSALTILGFLRQPARVQLPWFADKKPCPWHSRGGARCPCGAPKATTPPVVSDPSPLELPPEPTDEIAALRAEIAELRKMIAALTHGPPGERGPAGERDEPGPAGPPGADSKEKEPVIDYAKLTSALAFQIQDANGNVMRDADGKLMEFSPNDEGVVAFKFFVPVGKTANP